MGGKIYLFQGYIFSMSNIKLFMHNNLHNAFDNNVSFYYWRGTPPGARLGRVASLGYGSEFVLISRSPFAIGQGKQWVLVGWYFRKGEGQPLPFSSWCSVIIMLKQDNDKYSTLSSHPFPGRAHFPPWKPL